MVYKLAPTLGFEIMISSFSEKTPVHQHGMTAYKDLEVNGEDEEHRLKVRR